MRRGGVVGVVVGESVVSLENPHFVLSPKTESPWPP